MSVERAVSIGEMNLATLGDDGRERTTRGHNRLFKHDFENSSQEIHAFGRPHVPGECIFVPASPDAAEDDGYVMTFVNDLERGATDLIILAAQDFGGDPVATVHLPARIPLGFHGNWIPASYTENQ